MRLRESNRPVSKQRGRAFLLLVGTVGIAFALVLLYVGYTAPNGIPGRGYYNVDAEFDDADNLTKSYQVRIGGRLVGQILDPRVEDGKGVVRLQLTPDIKPLLSDTRLTVRPRSAVGVRFVELKPGTRGLPLREGDRIPADQTSETVQLDEAFGTLDRDRRKKAQIFLRELGGGLASRGDDINETVRDAPTMLSDLGAVAGAINARKGAPERFVAQSQAAANAADPVREDIARGFEPEADALRPFADHADGLREALDVAPGALRATRAGLVQTEAFLTETRAAASALEPTLRAGVPALRDTSALLRDARPGLRALPDTLRNAERAVDPTVNVLGTLQPVLPNLDQALREPIGILDVLAPRSCDITRMFDNWASMLGFGTRNGTVLRFNIIASTESFSGFTEESGAGAGPIESNPYPEPCVAGSEKKP